MILDRKNSRKVRKEFNRKIDRNVQTIKVKRDIPKWFSKKSHP